MRIAINLLNFRPGKIGGAETYLRELCNAMAASRAGHDLVLIKHEDNADIIDPPETESIVVARSDAEILRARVLEAFTPYRAGFAEKAIAKAAPDVVLHPQQSMFPKRCRAPSVLSVMDLQHLELPENFSLFTRSFRRAIYDYSLRQASRIITISDYTRRSILERYPEIDRETITTIRLGPPTLSDHPAGPVLPAPSKPFLYYPASALPHKNHEGLLESVAKLHRMGRFPYELLLSGSRPPYWRVIERAIDRLDLGSVVRHVGHVGYSQVLDLYSQCAAVVFPSKFEGFGLPVVEAASLGKKVITSRLDVFREIGVPDEYRIDFDDPRQLAAALDSTAGIELRTPPVTWPEHARATRDICLEAAGMGVLSLAH